MKLQSLNQVHIPVPCHENWDAMTEAEKGRFCAVCQKTVVDFSQMNENEIITILNEKLQTEKVCGRFEKTQIEPKTSWTNKFSQKLRYFALALLMAFGIPKMSKAQLHENPNKKEHLIGEMVAVPTGGISGTIKNKSTNIIISQAEVQIWQGNKYLSSVKTNHNGFYQLKNLDAGEYTLKVFKQGYNFYEVQNIRVIAETNITSDILLEKTPKTPRYEKGDVHVVGMIAPDKR
jgi:hypothetical protein